MDPTDKTTEEILEMIGSSEVPLHSGIPVYEDSTMPHRDEDGSYIHCRYVKLPKISMGKYFDLPSVNEYVLCSAQFMAKMREKFDDKGQPALVENTDDDL
jgi:hypothetical protein